MTQDKVPYIYGTDCLNVIRNGGCIVAIVGDVWLFFFSKKNFKYRVRALKFKNRVPTVFEKWCPVKGVRIPNQCWLRSWDISSCDTSIDQVLPGYAAFIIIRVITLKFEKKLDYAWKTAFSKAFLPEASFGLRVLSSPASVYLSVCLCVCVSITCLSAR